MCIEKEQKMLLDVRNTIERTPENSNSSDCDGMEEDYSIASMIANDSEFTPKKQVKSIQKLLHKKYQQMQLLSK